MLHTMKVIRIISLRKDEKFEEESLKVFVRETLRFLITFEEDSTF
jgi:hypothetical protein